MKKIVLTALFAISSPIFAQGYVGIGVGQSSVDIKSTPYTVDKQDSDTAGSIFGGVELNKNFAIEAGYVNLGEFGLSEANSFTDGVLFYNESLIQNVEGSAFYAAIVGKLPITNGVELFAKGGFARWNIDLAGTYTIAAYDGAGTFMGSGSASDSLSESGVDPMFGVGVSFNVTEVLMVRAEIERFMDVGDENTTGQSDVDVIGLSAAVKF